MKINPRGYWENNSTEGHGSDPGLMNGLTYFFTEQNANTIIDIGCGDGAYTLFLRNQGFDCKGFDGNPYTEQITGGICKVADFSKIQTLGNYDWVLSLEVAEHIPVEYEDIFLQNLDYHNYNGIVLSWSIPSHGGDGHVNPRENDYVIDKMFQWGYNMNLDWTCYLRDCCADYPNPCWWFNYTLLVFDKGV